jgi:flagellar biosynthesis GTPase FlhF
MRLKSYQAATMKEALALVREELGKEAILIPPLPAAMAALALR